MNKITVFFNKFLTWKKVIFQSLISLLTVILIFTFGQYLYDKSLAPVWFNINFWIEDNNSEVLRNIIFALGATFGLVIAIWRGWAHHIQSKAQNLQAVTAEKSQLTDMFSRAIEQLGNDEVTIRIGGVYTLIQIHNDANELYGEVIAKTLISHINNKLNEENNSPQKVTEDIISILSAKELDFSLIPINNCRFNLYKSSFNKLEKLNISNSTFENNFYEKFEFKNLSLYKISFYITEMNQVRFENLDINTIQFTKSKLTDTTFNKSEIYNLSLESSQIERLVFKETKINLSNISVSGSTIQFQNCNISSLKMSDNMQNDLSFISSNLERIIFDSIEKSNLNFVDCELSKVSFNSMHLNYYELENTKGDIKFNDQDIVRLDVILCNKFNTMLSNGNIEELRFFELEKSIIHIENMSITEVLNFASVKNTSVEMYNVDIKLFDITDTNLSSFILKDSRIYRIILNDFDQFKDVKLSNSSIKETNFKYFEWINSEFINSHFYDCKMNNNFVFNNCIIDIIFENCNLKSIKFLKCTYKRIVLINCDFNYKSFNGIDEHKLFINPDNFDFNIP